MPFYEDMGAATASGDAAMALYGSQLVLSPFGVYQGQLGFVLVSLCIAKGGFELVAQNASFGTAAALIVPERFTLEPPLAAC